MDNLHQDFNSSTLVNPNFTFHGNKENELGEEMGFKIKISDNKTVLEKKILAKRKKSETLDVEQQPRLSKSFSFDSIASRFPVVNTQNDVKNTPLVDSSLTMQYDPVKNYLNPMFSPDRHREILARQETVDRIRKSASYDCVMNLSDEESESGVCSVEETSEINDKTVNTGEETVNRIRKSAAYCDCVMNFSDELESGVFPDKETIEINTGEESGDVTDLVVDNAEETGEFENKNGWSLKVLLKWLVLMVVVILTTLTISSVNSPTPSPVKEAIRGFMDLHSKIHSAAGFDISEVFKAIKKRNYDYEEWDKKDLVVNGDELVEIQHEQIDDICEDKVETKDQGPKKEENEKIDVDPDDIWTRKDSQQFQESKTDDKNEEKVNEIFGQLQLIDPNQNDIIEGDVEGKEDDNNYGLNENETEGIKTAKFDPVFAAFIGIGLVIFASSCVLYYSTIQTEISTNESSSITSFGATGSVFSDIDQPSGSFTIEKIIVKKQKSKTPEAMISKVRRSSRIRNRSVTPSP